ncbi:type IX secretion system membrane protein PorP/SprF, partial [Pedobacter sp. BS3]|uniref:type IX secretion system membrane protein PorP/SprF n=1 Tax=Pedobacter sp. BS3 TaxID=2567937 RepID=UPI0011ECAD17
DNDKLLLDDNSDPSYMALVNGDNNTNRYGVNLGVALTGGDYYVAYALTDVVQKDDNGNQGIAASSAMQHIVQAGYRREVAPSIGLIINGIYRYDKNQKGVAEGQLKGVLSNTFWVGAGYRNDLAYTFNAGVRIKQLQVGYTREMSSGKTDGIYRGGNEITLSYTFAPVFGKKLSVW